MGILRDHYLSRSNFTAEPPLFMGLTHSSTGEVFTRSGPGPQHNRDYGLFARFTGPGGNRILVFAGIADVGVSAIVRFAGTADGPRSSTSSCRHSRNRYLARFEVLVEARGHSRTDLDSPISSVLTRCATHSPCRLGSCSTRGPTRSPYPRSAPRTSDDDPSALRMPFTCCRFLLHRSCTGTTCRTRAAGRASRRAPSAAAPHDRRNAGRRIPISTAESRA